MQTVLGREGTYEAFYIPLMPSVAQLGTNPY